MLEPKLFFILKSDNYLKVLNITFNVKIQFFSIVYFFTKAKKIMFDLYLYNYIYKNE